jgi:hypothetical protein
MWIYLLWKTWRGKSLGSSNLIWKYALLDKFFCWLLRERHTTNRFLRRRVYRKSFETSTKQRVTFLLLIFFCNLLGSMLGRWRLYWKIRVLIILLPLTLKLGNILLLNEWQVCLINRVKLLLMSRWRDMTLSCPKTLRYILLSHAWGTLF